MNFPIYGSQTLQNIMNVWTAEDPNEGSGIVAMPFNLEKFCTQNDVSLMKLKILEAKLQEWLDRPNLIREPVSKSDIRLLLAVNVNPSSVPLSEEPTSCLPLR